MVLRLGSLAILALFLSLALADKCSEFKDNCNSETKRMVEIKCDNDGCACSGSVEDADTNTVDCTTEIDGLIGGDDVQSLTAERCEELCVAANDTECKYFKWTEIRDKKKCYLMDSAQCSDQSGDSCRSPHCKSDGVDCDVGPTPPDPPEGTNCTMSLPEHDTDNLRWHCYNAKLAPYPAVVEVYGSPGTPIDIFPETVCETMHLCDAYAPQNKLVYVCGEKDGEGKDGEWAHPKDEFDADTEILEADATSIEVEAGCALEPLKNIKKDKVDLAGVDLVCTGAPLEEDPDNADSYQLPGPNTCILLCDLNHVLTVYSAWTDTGKSWLMTFAEDDPPQPQPADGGEIYCWP